MTYDPNRDTRAPGETNPNRRPDARNSGGMGMGMVLGLLALVILGGLLFYNMRGDNNVASTNQPAGTQQSTTGSGSTGTTTPSATTPSATTPSTGTSPTDTTKPATTPAPARYFRFCCRSYRRERE